MGGICGIVNWRERVELWELERMAECAGYRGVDGIGYWNSQGAGLASLRHWQTKESYGEWEPSGNGEVVVTSDARLDNRQELIEKLIREGFRVDEESSDEELILRSYERWGERSGERLLGDFSFAVWDGRKRRLYGARDAMGMRPFYYREEEGRFLFGAEIQQMLVLPGVPVRIHEAAVGAHLAGVFGNLEWTFYEGIRQLPPGHAIVVEEGSVRIWRYWEAGGGRIRYRREEEYAEHFQELFKEAVRCRLRSDKPVGISLSGGMDSGSVASTAGWLMKRGEVQCQELRAYCWAFRELKECDERKISNGIVNHYGIALTEIEAEEAWPLQGYPKHGPHRDEPFFGVYQALLEKTLATARQNGSSLLLYGDRGDLTMGCGLLDFCGLLASGQLRQFLLDLAIYADRTGLTRGEVFRSLVVGALPAVLWPAHRLTRLRKLSKKYLWNSSVEPPTPPNPSWIGPTLSQVEIPGVSAASQSKVAPMVKGLAQRKRYEFIFHPFQMRGMLWSERTCAAFGIGFADPWSDRRIAEFALAVPQWLLNRCGDPKRLARKAMSGIMVEEVRRSVRKIVPTPLYQRALRDWSVPIVEDLLSGMKADQLGYVKESNLREHYRTIRGGGSISPAFWWALTLEMWLRQFWAVSPGGAVRSSEMNSKRRMTGVGQQLRSRSSRGQHLQETLGGD